MQALIVTASPNPQSFCHAMADVVQDVLRKRGYQIALHDLYTENFDPVQRTGEAFNTRSSDTLVETHCAQVAQADFIAVFHPNWWGQPPAILKGWIDRVLRLGTAYGYADGVSPDGVPVGLLKAKQALVFNTSNTPHQREVEVFGDPLETLWRHCVFGLCGVTTLQRRMFGPMASSTAEQRQQWLAQVHGMVEAAA